MPSDLICKTLLHSADDDVAANDDEPQHPVGKVFKAAESGFDADKLERETIQADYRFRKRFQRYDQRAQRCVDPREDPTRRMAQDR